MQMNRKTFILSALAGFAITSWSAMSAAADSTTELLPVTEVTWEQLNPARGDQSPQAATLWGDRDGTAPTGFLVKFVDGFSSPPHIHNVTYRAVVINGLIHNDDPDAAHMWMPVGSFWTQPKGDVHITAAKGATNVALVEIDKGPYRVLPPKEAFDSGERPINVDPSNLVWVAPTGRPVSPDGPQLAYLWGNLEDGQSNGTFIKLPAGFDGKIESHGDTFRAVVIQGTLNYGQTDPTGLEPGSYFGSAGPSTHQLSSGPGTESILYVRTDGRYNISSRRE
jgi:hypothetical protein